MRLVFPDVAVVSGLSSVWLAFRCCDVVTISFRLHLVNPPTQRILARTDIPFGYTVPTRLFVGRERAVCNLHYVDLHVVSGLDHTSNTRMYENTHTHTYVYGESNGKLPLRICPGCSLPEPYQSPDCALVSALTGPRAEYP